MNITALLIALIAVPSPNATRQPLMLDFQSKSCGPCNAMKPAIKQLIERGYSIKEIDIDEFPELAERYEVREVPTYIMIDGSGRVIARTKGAQAVGELAKFYRTAIAQLTPTREDVGSERAIAQENANTANVSDEDRPTTPNKVNPNPWSTVVRVKVKGNGSIGFGSGTIIHSTPEESIILTCAHVFKMDGQKPLPPSRFPLPIEIDLFDGVLHSKETPQVHHTETVKGEPVDYDFALDVGLIRIRPGRRLPASRVVPPHWKPQRGMQMTTVGCSEGHDATAWTTRISNPAVRLFTDTTYEGIECDFAPKQGRSGGGLYTIDGYLAGVCDFAEPNGDKGFYATPRSIYSILDKNRLTALYVPKQDPQGPLLANNRPRTEKRATPPSIARAQSPETEEPGDIMMPAPNQLGVDMPEIKVASAPANRQVGTMPWRATGEGQADHRPNPIKPDRITEDAGIQIASEANNDTFSVDPKASTPFVPEARDSTASRFENKWKPVKPALEP